ncbi:MAG TPA: TonB-dependent receptor [Bacteroidales bacterium]|nr:TonB-dependent receptor [Bacteroidales bacterium]
MKKMLLVYLILMLSVVGSAQIVTIKDYQTGEPLEMVTLISENPSLFATTNAKGQTNITAFEGVEKIEIRSLGYKTLVLSYDDLQLLFFELKLEQTMVLKEEVVVSATRWRESSFSIPSKIVTISAKDFAIQNPQTSADLLSLSGKIFIQKSQQGGGSPMIRGFATSRLLYAVDGVRMNTAIFRSGNIQNVISLDPFALESTEVLFGPNSVIYGSDAIGGVMSFQTLTPQLSTTNSPATNGQVFSRYSSANNEKTAHFDFNIGWKKWAILSSFSSFDFGDLKMGSFGPDEYLRPFYVQRQDSIDVVVANQNQQVQKPSGYSQMNIMQKIRFNPNEKWDLQYGFHYSETSSYSRYDRHVRYSNGLPRYGEWSYGPQIWMMNNLNVFYTAKNAFFDKATLRLAQQYFEESRISRNFNEPERERRTEKVNAYSANLDFMKTISPKNTLLYGIEYILNTVDSKGIDENIKTGISEIGPSRYPQSTWQSYAFYIDNQTKFSDKWLLQSGIRYNQFVLDAQFDTSFYPFPFTTAYINNGALTGSLGAVFRPSDDWVISANLATAFRAPNVDDMGKVFDSEPGAVVVPNPDLKAEYAYNVDVSVAKLFADILKIDFTAYYTILDNAMVRRDFTINGIDSIFYDGTLSKVQAIQNAAFAKVYGFQAGIELKLASGFSFSSDFNYQIGEEELDDGTTSPSRHAPPAYGISRLSYRVNKLDIQLYAVYSGQKDFEEMPDEEIGKTEIYAIDENGNPYSPRWYTLNFKLLYQISKQFSISTGMENISDQRYRTYSSGISAPGRNFILSARLTF